MLYAAGELPAEQQAALEARLAAEPELAAELARLRAAEEHCFAALALADEHDRLPVSEGVAVRRVARAMRQWLLDRTVAYSAGAPVAARRKLPWWVYSSATAAALLVGFLVWSVRQPVGAVMPPDEKVSAIVQQQQMELADWMSESLRSRNDIMADNEFVMSFAAPPAASNDDLDGVFLREEEQ